MLASDLNGFQAACILKVYLIKDWAECLPSLHSMQFYLGRYDTSDPQCNF